MNVGTFSTYMTETLLTSALNEQHEFNQRYYKAKVHTMLQGQHASKKTNFFYLIGRRHYMSATPIDLCVSVDI